MDVKKLIEKSNDEIQMEELEDLENNIKNINDIYKNINDIINTQGETIDTIEENMDKIVTQVEHTTNKISVALSYYESYKYYQYVLYGFAIIGTILIII